MRPHLLLLLAALVFLQLVAGWEREDHEIFRLRDEVMAGEGDDATFYDIMGVSPSATLDDINKAYRKKNRQLHPDKAIPSILAALTQSKRSKSAGKKSGVTVTKGPTQKERNQATKQANERYARLSVIASVLRGPQRERYDHFLKNGFPAWRGTGYYYERFRPGLGSVVFGLLVVFGGGAHYGAMYISWKRQRDFVQRYVSHARRMAWGNDSGIPGVPSAANGSTGVDHAAIQQAAQDSDNGVALNRRQKRMQEKENKKKDNSRAAMKARTAGVSRPLDANPIDGPQGSKKKVIAENGKVLIVDSVGNVFLEEETEDGEKHEFLLDPDEIPRPTIFQTILFRLPVWSYNQTVGRALGKSNVDDEILNEDEQIMVDGTGEHEDDIMQSATAVNPHQENKKRKAKAR